MLKRLLSILLCGLIFFGLTSCGTVQHKDVTSSPDTAGIELPEDFSFSIVWNTYGISSYDSETGKLVKASDATDVSKYTAYVKMSPNDLKTVYRALFCDIDLTAYPDSYDPFNAPDATSKVMSSPTQTVIITATANGVTKTVTCEKIVSGYTLQHCYSDEAKAFWQTKLTIVNLIESFPEWQAFPDYEFFYQ